MVRYCSALKGTSIMLADYMRNYFGFGDPKSAKYWFIGVEDGGDKKGGYLHQRIKAWQKRHQQRPVNFVSDIDVFHDEMLAPDRNIWFRGEIVRIQATWNRLIACILALRGEQNTTETRREFQRNELARKDNLIAELWPLPFPLKLSELDINIPPQLDIPLARRGAYHEDFANRRIAEIQRYIKNHPPEVVIVYGADPRQYLLEAVPDFGLIVRDNIIWAAAPHPNRERNLAPWMRLGQAIRQQLLSVP